MSNFFNRLQEETLAERSAFLQIEQLARGARGEISLGAYQAFLGEAYQHVKHTVPLLMACSSRLPADQEGLRQAVAHYIEEEIGHEEWILNDLSACGSDPQMHRCRAPAPETELMVAYVYDTIQRGNPVGFFGMVLVLEGTSIQLATHAAAAIQASLSLPKEAFSYLVSHGSLDISHMQFFESLMNRIDDPDDQQAIIHMANMMYRLYGDVFRSLPLDS
ncbi:MAG TPA: iron-containing redox enzyme family protein [Gammaproteobacteria bacterium]|nr:iron-containing redox enzyme family protein [Gammaproteobacteria bacterium]